MGGGVVMSLLVELKFRHLGQEAPGAHETAFGDNSGHVFQEMGVADIVKSVDSKADADHEFSLQSALDEITGSQAGRVFLRRAQARFIASHENIGASIHDDERIRTHLDQLLIGA